VPAGFVMLARKMLGAGGNTACNRHFPMQTGRGMPKILVYEYGYMAGQSLGGRAFRDASPVPETYSAVLPLEKVRPKRPEVKNKE